MKKIRRVFSLLLTFSLLLLNVMPVLAAGLDMKSGMPVDAMEEINAEFGDLVIGKNTLDDDGYIGIPADLTLLFDVQNHEMIPSYNGTPLVLYVVNTATERVGTDSDVTIISDMISKGYLVAVLDYRNNAKSVSPGLDWSTQLIRESLLSGEFFDGTVIPADASYTEGYVVPAGYNISKDHIFWEIDKHGADGSLEKIVEIWNNDFRGVRGETVVYWLDDDGNKKATQTAFDGSEPVWVDDSHIKIKYTKAETIYDCVKKDGSFIDLNLYMNIVYPTNPKNDVPVFCYASCGENLMRFWNVSYAPHLSGFLFAGYAGVMYDYCYTPMARNDHYGYYDGDASKGHITGDNQTYSIDVYNEKKTNTAAMRYIRLLSERDNETFRFDTEHIGIIGHSKSGVVTFMGAEHPELMEEVRIFPGHRGETRYENGITEDDAFGLIDGGEEQPWLTYSDGTPIDSGADFICASAGSRAELIDYGHAPTFLIGAMSDFTYAAFYPNTRNALQAYDVPALDLRVKELEHHIPHGIDCDFGLDSYVELFKFAHYWLRGDAAECVYITPMRGTIDVSTTEMITVKFNGSISYEEVQKVTVVNRENGKAATGRWESQFGNTEWRFYPDTLDGGAVYTVTVPDTIVDDVNNKNLKETKTVSFRTEYEKADAPVLQSENMTLINTEASSNGVYYVFNVNNVSEEYKLRVKVTNDAHNTLTVYSLDAIDRSILSDSTVASNAIGEILLSGKGYYDIDVTDAVKNAGGEIGFFIELGKSEGNNTVYSKDFEDCTVGSSKLPKDIYYYSIALADGIMSNETGSIALKLNVVPNGDRVIDGKEYNSSFTNNTFYVNPSYALTIGNIFANRSLQASDFGRTFRFSIRMYDTTSRMVVLQIGNVYETKEMMDLKPMKYSFYTTAGEWSTFTVDFTLDNPDYWNGMNKNKATLMINAANSDSGEELPVYVDDITVVETVTNAQIGGVSLISYPTDTQVFSPVDQVSFDSDGNILDGLTVSGDKLGTKGHGAKAYVKYDLSSFDETATTNYASFHIASSGAATVKIYGVTDTTDWSSSSLNWFNAIANDRYSSGVNTEKVYLGKEIATISVDGTSTYSVDIGEYVKYMISLGAKTATLIIACEDSDGYMKLTPIGGSVVFYENYEDGTTKRFLDPLIDGTSTGLDEYCDYDFMTRGTIDYPSLASKLEMERNVTPFGKDSLRMGFPSKNAAIKFFNIFGKNLTDEDVGDKYTIRFSMSTDAESFEVCYGFMSSTSNYSSPYTGDKLYNPNTGKAVWGNTENVATLYKDKWTEIEFTFTVTTAMLGEYTDVNGNTVSNNVIYTYNDGADSCVVHCNYALLSFLAKEVNTSANIFLDDILVVKEQEAKKDSEYGKVAGFDYDNVTLNTFPDVTVNGISLGIDEYCPEYTSVVRSTNWPKLSSDYDHTTGSGKSLVMTMDNKNAMLKIPNLFGKNLTDDDIGDYYTISFYVNTDIDSMRFAYGFASSTTNYASPYTGDKIYDPVQNKVGNIYAPTIPKNQWTKITYTFPITKAMLGSYTDESGNTVYNNQIFEYNGESYTAHCNYAFLVFRAWYDSYQAGGEYVNSHLYIDDITVTRTLSDGTVPLEGENIVNSEEYASVEGVNTPIDGLLGSGDTIVERDVTSAYLTFNKEDFIDTQKATLNVSAPEALGVMLTVYGVRAPKSYDGIFDVSKFYNGAALGSAIVGEDGIARIDVSEYVKSNYDIGYGFIVICEQAGDLDCFTFELSNAKLTADVDYTLIGSASAKIDVEGMHISDMSSGDGIIFKNVFGEGNSPISVGKYTFKSVMKNTSASEAVYTLALTDKNGKAVGSGASITLAAGESGTLALELDIGITIAQTNASSIIISSVSGADVTITEISVFSENTVKISDNSELVVELPPVLDQLKIIGAFLNIQENINVGYTVVLPAGYENPYMVFEFNGKTYKVTKYTTNADGSLVFKFVGVTPQKIGDNIKATLYNADGTVADEVATYSVKQYCVNMLPNADAKLKTLLSDLLVYGATAQLYVDPNTSAEELVTYGVEGLAPSTFEQVTDTDMKLDGVKVESVTWNGAALRYENTMAMKLSFTATDVAKLTVKVTINSRTTEFTADDFYIEKGKYVVYFRGILATEYDDVVTASFYVDGEQVGQTATYSVNSYVKSKQNDSNTALAELVKATYNYGASAEAYVGQ